MYILGLYFIMLLFIIGCYQSVVFDSNCINCQKVIKSDDNLGKFSRNISGKILIFCGTECVESYENRLVLCNFCQKELVETDSKIMV